MHRPARSVDAAGSRWPEEPLRTMLLRALAKLGVAAYAKKYPAVQEALLKSLLETVCKCVAVAFSCSVRFGLV